MKAAPAAAGPARALRWLKREVIRRRLPHGLVHWRYLERHPPAPLVRQRAVWRASLPRLPSPLWAAVEAWLWLRWQLWSGPASVVRVVRWLGPGVREEEGIGILAQGKRVSALALGYCVPPFEIYRHRLYLRENCTAIGELVFEHTAEAYRHTVDTPGADARRSRELLSDKERQATDLGALGVPVAPTAAVLRRGSGLPLERWLGDGKQLFGKPRHGSQGAGAFSAAITDGTLTIQPLNGLALRGNAAQEYWSQLLARDDMLLQPRLSVHSALTPAADDCDIVTARYITRRARAIADDIEPYSATLELPVQREGATGHCVYVVLAVDPASGEIDSFPQRYLRAEALARQRWMVARLSVATVPGWRAVAAASALAHKHFPGVHAIAWDWALTDCGPLLLEGNTGWGTAVPQQLRGGLLSAEVE